MGALGVAAARDGAGLTPMEHRHIIAAEYECDGIIDGLDVRGRADLTYQVTEGVALCQRSTADGMTLAYWPGGQSPVVSANTSSNPRIDCVWIRSNNEIEYHAEDDLYDHGNAVEIGVTQGEPASNPVAPSLPPNSTLVRRVRVPAGAASTQNVTVDGSVDYAVSKYTNGRTIGFTRLSNDFTFNSTNWTSYCRTQIMIPVDRMLRFELTCNPACDPPGGALDFKKYCELMVGFRIDGRQYGMNHYITCYGAWDDKYVTDRAECVRGTHDVDVIVKKGNGNAGVKFHGGVLPGFVLRVTDQGPVR